MTRRVCRGAAGLRANTGTRASRLMRPGCVVNGIFSEKGVSCAWFGVSLPWLCTDVMVRRKGSLVAFAANKLRGEVTRESWKGAARPGLVLLQRGCQASQAESESSVASQLEVLFIWRHEGGRRAASYELTIGNLW